MAEYDGAGYPIAYLFRRTKYAADTAAQRKKIEEARLGTLKALLTELRKRGVNPRFVGSDKDFHEIRAVDEVWPEAKHQLWYVMRLPVQATIIRLMDILLSYWHAKRAIDKRLHLPPNKVNNEYNPFMAAQDVGLEDFDQTFLPNNHQAALNFSASGGNLSNAFGNKDLDDMTAPVESRLTVRVHPFERLSQWKLTYNTGRELLPRTSTRFFFQAFRETLQLASHYTYQRTWRLYRRPPHPKPCVDGTLPVLS
jgi:hypothetical protein